MSKLEAKISSFATPMIASGDPTVLDVERQTLLASWALKTAMMFEFARPAETIVYRYYTSTERQQLKELLMPPENVVVWLGRQVTHAPGYPSVNSVLATVRDGAEIVKGHVSTLWFGQLVVQVLAHRPGEIRVGDRVPIRRGPWNWNMTTLQIWPPSQLGVIWPPAAMTLEAFGALTTRFALSPLPKNRPHRTERSL
jgi:hypothetical protein